MKRRNIILSMLFAAFFANGAQAGTGCADAAPADARDAENIDRVQSLLEQLGDAKALEVDENGNVRVKPSVVERLKAQGRLMNASGSWGSICN